MQEKLAMDILRELHRESKRRFILLLICIVLLFASNMAWLIAWNLPAHDTTESYDLQGQDDANVIMNSQGEVKINEQNQSEETDNN